MAKHTSIHYGEKPYNATVLPTIEDDGWALLGGKRTPNRAEAVRHAKALSEEMRHWRPVMRQEPHNH